MEESRFEVNLILSAFKMCLRKHVLFWEGGGLLAGFACFNFFSNLGMLPTSKAFVFPPLFLLGLFLLYVCIAIGNAGATVLLSKGDSSLREWSDVAPFDKKFIRAILTSILFFVFAALLIILAVFVSLPAKGLRSVWIAFFSLPVILLSLASVITMFQGLFVFPAFLSTEQDEADSLRRFIRFLHVNWARMVGFEALFLGMALLLALPPSALAYLALEIFFKISDSLGLVRELRLGFSALVLNTWGIAPITALCFVIPTSFVTTASFLFCRSMRD